MSTWRPVLPIVLVLTSCGAGDRAAQETQPSATSAGWQLTWSDEFDAAEGSAPDPSRWAFDLGGGGWGNNELQSYTDRRENVSVRGGMLVIRVARESFTGAGSRVDSSRNEECVQHDAEHRTSSHLLLLRLRLD